MYAERCKQLLFQLLTPIRAAIRLTEKRPFRVRFCKSFSRGGEGGPSHSPPPSPACRTGSLKIQLQRELEGARGLLGSNRGERSRGRGGVRPAKHGLVEEVEHV